MDHSPGHDHTHPHGHHHHDHAHDHGHSHSDYYIEQLLTVLISGAFGMVAILMYFMGMLNFLLVERFHLWVLAGGIALLVMTLIRGVALFLEDAHEHAHDHADHEHGNIFWRVVILAFPILLFCFGLPNSSFSQDYINKRLGKAEDLSQIGAVDGKGGDVMHMTLQQLSTVTYNAKVMEQYEGRTVSLTGTLRREGEGDYTLYTGSMACCVADTVYLTARVITENFLPQMADDTTVQVEGVLQFVSSKKGREPIPVIVVDDPMKFQTVE